jgi:hypothetical protein
MATPKRPDEDPDMEIAALRLDLERAREERIMAALWGSTDEHAPRIFSLWRNEDVTGVSGTGLVAHGVEFHDGAVVIRWSSETPSTVVWSGLDDAMRVHGHDGRTRVVWLSEHIDDVIDLAVETVEDRLRTRVHTPEVRRRVAESISAADPIDSQWEDCLNLADAAIHTLLTTVSLRDVA